MAITQTDVDRLEKALASGILTVEYDGVRRTFKSTDELLQAIAYCKNQLAAQQAGATSVSYAGFSRD